MVTRRLIGAAARRPRLPSPAVERRLGRDNRYAQPLHLALRRVKADPAQAVTSRAAGTGFTAFRVPGRVGEPKVPLKHPS
jgi:hypothetical protein